MPGKSSVTEYAKKGGRPGKEVGGPRCGRDCSEGKAHVASCIVTYYINSAMDGELHF